MDVSIGVESQGNVVNLLKSPAHLPGMRQRNYCGRIRWLLGHDKAPSCRRHGNVPGRFQRNDAFTVPRMGCVTDPTTLEEKKKGEQVMKGIIFGVEDKKCSCNRQE